MANKAGIVRAATVVLQSLGSATVDGAAWSLATSRLGIISSVPYGEYPLNVQMDIPVTGATASYEKAAILVQVQTADPSGAGAEKDAVPFDGRARIMPGNKSGRVWGGAFQANVDGDGLAYGVEAAVSNNGSDQPAPGTATSKYASHEIGAGPVPITAYRYSEGLAHHGWLVFPSALCTGQGDSLFQLVGRFAVWQDGSFSPGIGGARISSIKRVRQTVTLPAIAPRGSYPFAFPLGGNPGDFALVTPDVFPGNDVRFSAIVTAPWQTNVLVENVTDAWRGMQTLTISVLVIALGGDA